MKYCCEECNERFDTENEALDCERKHIENAEKRKRFTEEKSTRLAEIKEMVTQYNNDYDEDLILYKHFSHSYCGDDIRLDNVLNNVLDSMVFNLD